VYGAFSGSAGMTERKVKTKCCIAGGGPAGMMLGYLLARAGVGVLVLEKHADFLRDFRGDTVHPSTLEVMYELGLLKEFLKRPHEEVGELSGIVNGEEVKIAELAELPTHCKFIALMPQWDFLDFLAEKAKKFPEFALRMEARATGLVEKDGRVTGLRAETKEGVLEVEADLVVAADGRYSEVRKAAGLELVDYGAPIDVLWMRISRREGDPEATGGRFAAGRILVTINRRDYWQCAFVVPKGGIEEIHAAGLAAFQQQIAKIAPFLGDRVGELDSWEKVKLLTVAVNRLRHWAKPGLLCIGDAAHAMSPVGGVGINLAIQDAVAAANLLAGPLRSGKPTVEQLEEVQKRREWPTKVTQRVQIFMHKNILSRALGKRPETEGKEQRGAPALLKIARHVKFLRRIPARVFALGLRPEHVSAEIVEAGRS
jgi:2-polyprenyl-6-methoxyphenol hydroxylase-like FAD-dependent oxidoreductase